MPDTVVTKRIKADGAGKYIHHGPIKYRPEVISKFKDGSDVTFRLPRRDASDAYATVSQSGVTETWKPSGV